MTTIDEAWAGRYHPSGEPVVGVVGGDLPPAWLAALGVRPVRLAGAPEPPSGEAVALLGAATDAPTLSILTQLLDGRFDFLAGLVVTRDCAASLNLFYVLRGLRLPFPVHLCQLLHLPRRPTEAFNDAQLRRTTAEVGRWVGAAFSTDRYSAEVKRYAELDAAMRALQARRRTGAGLDGSTFLQAVGIATTYPPEVARTLIQGIPDGEPARFRLFYTGSAQHHPGLYRAIEARGAVVVGEDHDWGDLYFRDAPAGPTGSSAARAAWTAAEFRACRADALLAVVREHDDGPAWDLPAQRSAINAPVAVCSRQNTADYDEVLDAVDTLKKATA